MKLRNQWRMARTAALCVMLAACSSLPTLNPDMARRAAAPVQLDGPNGPLSAARSKAILKRLNASGGDTHIFDLHLAVEESIAGSPLTTGNSIELLQNGPDTYGAMIEAIDDRWGLVDHRLDQSRLAQLSAQSGGQRGDSR